jgi:hypothetical protein
VRLDESPGAVTRDGARLHVDVAPDALRSPRVR